MSDLFFHDPSRDERVWYSGLGAELSGGVVEYAPWVRPISPGEAASVIAKAVLLRRPLTLFDSDSRDEELRALGVDPAALAVRERASGLAKIGLEAALETARREPGFQLTLFTSGTTGRPKKVTHDLAGLTRMLRVSPRHGTDVWGLAYNPTHIAGVQIVLQALFNRNPLVHLFHAPPERVAAWMRENGVTHISATPSFYRLLLPQASAQPSVRAVTLGGERADEGLLGELARLFPKARIRNLYASTEAGTLFEAEGEWFIVPAALRDHVRFQDGELTVRRSLLGRLEGGEGEGEWFATGDLVELDDSESVRFRVLGRRQDWVNVGGHKVNPADVESVLACCPGVREARVYGRANSVLGQILCADVVVEPGFVEEEARAWLTERLQAVKVPRWIRQVSEIRRTRTGKVART
jgi:acyl-coenzyme A synthetase/AMP-(fatty) acid ligase